MKFLLAIIAITSPLFLHNHASAQYNKQRGVVLGGLTGAAAGAIIGENSDEPGAGAAIGGVVGAIAGSILGNAEDQQARAYYAHQQQQVYAQQQYQATQTVALGDIIAMSRSGVSDHVIVTAIQQRGLQRPLEVADIVHLSQNGVGDHVIRAMQQIGGSPIGVPVAAPVVVARPTPTVVIRSAPVTRHYGYGRPPYHNCHRAQAHPRSHSYYVR